MLQEDYVEKLYVKLLTVTSIKAVKCILPVLLDSHSYLYLTIVEVKTFILIDSLARGYFKIGLTDPQTRINNCWRLIHTALKDFAVSNAKCNFVCIYRRISKQNLFRMTTALEHFFSGYALNEVFYAAESFQV